MSNIIRFDDLNNEEKLALTDEQVKGYIDLECAYEGVKILPNPEKPVEPELGEKTIFYRVGYNSDLTFVKTEDAAKALEVLSKLDVIQTTWAGDYTYVYEIHKFEKSIQPESFYSKEQYLKHKDELEKYRREKSSYEELKKEYDKGRGLVEKIEERIWDDITEVRKIKNLQDNLAETYTGYLVMAKGDAEVAMSFLKNAYKDDLNKITKGIGVEKFEVYLNDLKTIKLMKKEEGVYNEKIGEHK